MIKEDCNNCKHKDLPCYSATCVECGLSRINYVPATKCSSYREEKNWLGLTGVCYGTKEREPCSCNGDEIECDFYDYIRRRAARNLTNLKCVQAMKAEELADFLARVQFDVLEKMFNIIAMKPPLKREELSKEWLKWLMEESKEI